MRRCMPRETMNVYGSRRILSRKGWRRYCDISENRQCFNPVCWEEAMTIVCNDPMVRRRLAAYAAERNELLTAIVGALQRDSRVMAAWLFGSIGRGTADELSDLDLFVIIEDDRLAEVIETRYAMF